MTSAIMTALFFSLLPAVGLAQTTPPPSGPRVLRILTPNNGFAASGNLTSTGVAVDCGSGQPARRVAIYDGTSVTQSAYVADVSMDTSLPLSTYCSGKTGTDKIGFTVIFATTRLSDGYHTLTFVAEYSGGVTQTATLDISVSNRLDFDLPCNQVQEACNVDANTGGTFVPAGTIVGDRNPPAGLYGRPFGTSPAAMQCDPFGGNCFNNVSGYYGPIGPNGPPGPCVGIDLYGRCVAYQTSGGNLGVTYPYDVPNGCSSYDSLGQCVGSQGSNGAAPYVVPCPATPTTYCIYDGSTFVPVRQ